MAQQLERLVRVSLHLWDCLPDFVCVCVCVFVCALPFGANNNQKHTNYLAPATQITVAVFLCVPAVLALF